MYLSCILCWILRRFIYFTRSCLICYEYLSEPFFFFFPLEILIFFNNRWIGILIDLIFFFFLALLSFERVCRKSIEGKKKNKWNIIKIRRTRLRGFYAVSEIRISRWLPRHGSVALALFPGGLIESTVPCYG